MTSEFDEVRRLLLAARGGDLGSLDAVVRTYGPHVLQAVRREMGETLRSRLEEEDLAQDVWTRALRSVDSFRGDTDAAFRSWLATMASNVARDHARRAKARGAGRDVPLDGTADGSGDARSAPLMGAVAASGPSPSGVIRRRERSARLDAALAALSEDHRRVIELVRLEGLTVKDVAARMGRSPNAVSMLLLRALRELKGRFGGTESFSLPRPEITEAGSGERRGEANGDDRSA